MRTPCERRFKMRYVIKGMLYTLLLLLLVEFIQVNRDDINNFMDSKLKINKDVQMNTTEGLE